MLPLVEKSEQEKYWKQKNIPAYTQFGTTFLSFLRRENVKLNTIKLSSKFEHSQRFLSSIFMTNRAASNTAQVKATY